MLEVIGYLKDKSLLIIFYRYNNLKYKYSTDTSGVVRIMWILVESGGSGKDVNLIFQGFFQEKLKYLKI
ncbi:MAG: hypothetical protein AMR96_05085 [Candidatus Adiutrix intracellularis]|jgi:hypothetical protein|nr:MAG: hypothetical protein AMR96_05085 [Candidatus Adiutrix intracellularis]